MRTVWLAMVMWSMQGAAEKCADQHAICMENCHIDFGMEASRNRLEKCFQLCEKMRRKCAPPSRPSKKKKKSN